MRADVKVKSALCLSPGSWLNISATNGIDGPPVTLFYVLVLSAAVSMDALASGVAYGVKGIHVPVLSLGVIGAVTVVCAVIAMEGTLLFSGLIDKRVATVSGALLLCALGVDNMVAVSAVSLTGQMPVYTPLVMGLVQVGFIMAGSYGCEWLTDHHVRFRLPYLSGAMLIALGLARLAMTEF